MKPCVYDCIPASLQQNVCGSVFAALVNGLLDRNGSISITNDGKINGDLVFTVRHNIMQPLVVTLNLWQIRHLQSLHLVKN